MRVRLIQRATVLTGAVLCIAGIVEGIRIDEPSVSVLFALTFVIGAVIAMDRAAERPIRVRSDLREWLDDTASVTGDTIEELSNAALSSYRAQLGEGPHD